MKKKDLISQNSSLFFKNDELQGQYNELKRENELLKAKNIELINETENIKLQLEACKNVQVVEERKEKPFPKELDYAAKVIGEIVVNAAMKCNSLTKDGNIDNRELVNLILGRTEVAKAEILNISAMSIGDGEKISKINSEKELAFDYFLSILAQNN